MITFKDIRSGYMVHIFDRKQTRYIEAEVIDVSSPRVRTVAEMAGGMGMVVDATVRVDGTDKIYTVGAEDSHASGGDYYMSTDKESIANEVKATRRTSEDALFAMDKHKDIVEKCSDILQSLDPQYGNAAETDRELKSLRGEISELKEMIMIISNQCRTTE